MNGEENEQKYAKIIPRVLKS